MEIGDQVVLSDEGKTQFGDRYNELRKCGGVIKSIISRKHEDLICVEWGEQRIKEELSQRWLKRINYHD